MKEVNFKRIYVKRFVAFLSAICLVFSIIQIDVYASFQNNSVERANYTTKVSSASDLSARLSALISKYQGTYWTSTGSACGNHSSKCYSKYYYGWQCKGFASYIFNDLFCGGYIGAYDGEKYYIPSPNGASLIGKAWGFSSTDIATVKSILSQGKQGDYIQVRRRGKTYGHSMILVSTDANGVYLFDCNSDGKCGVRYYHQTWNDFASKNSGMSLYRSTSYPAGNVSCSCSDSYAGNYICNTSSVSLNIRSGHGTSHSVVGSIPKGARVYVSKADGTWAHVEYNGVSGYASMQYLTKETNGNNESNDNNESSISGVLTTWVSFEGMGEAASDIKQGDFIYLCYRMYDTNSGKNMDELLERNYSVTETIYKPDGSIANTYTYDNDNNWIGYQCEIPGKYTYKVELSGEWTGTATGDFVVQDNPKSIYASASDINLTIGESETSSVSVWTGGYYNNATYLNFSIDNNNISASWGEWNSEGKIPLTIKANSQGESVITLSVRDNDTGAMLDSYTIRVKVSSKSYTVSYNANGGSLAPENQIKAFNSSLTISESLPIRFGYTFLGWSTSSTASYPTYMPSDEYFGNANLSLYAVWEPATIISSDVTNSSFNTNIKFAYGYKYYKFTPSSNAKYCFESSGNNDTQVYIYDASGNELVMNDDAGVGANFKITYSFKAGNTYYVKVRMYSSNIGVVNYTVKKVNDPLSASLTIGGSTSSITKKAGEYITLNVAATGGTGNYTYKFAVLNQDTGKWSVLKDFSSSSSYTTVLKIVGAKQFAVTVKDSSGNTVATNRMSVKATSDALNGKLTVGNSTNKIIKTKGSKITINASATGGTGNYTYRFAVLNVDTGKWSVLRDFSSNASYTYALNYPGTKQFAVTIKDSSGKTVATNRLSVVVNN